MYVSIVGADYIPCFAVPSVWINGSSDNAIEAIFNATDVHISWTDSLQKGKGTFRKARSHK